MHRIPVYANGCFWPKADIRTESKAAVLNVCFGEKSGHSWSDCYNRLIQRQVLGSVK